MIFAVFTALGFVGGAISAGVLIIRAREDEAPRRFLEPFLIFLICVTLVYVGLDGMIR
jgi:hypothetical protein